MKLNKFFGIFAAATAMLAAGCSTDLTEDVIVEASGNEATTTVVFTADCGDAVRNNLDSETFKVTWAGADKIKVNGATSTATELLEDGAKANFTVSLTTDQNKAPFHAIYPAGKWTVPAANSTDPHKCVIDSRFLIPEGGNIHYPMIAVSESSTNLSFKHLTGLVKLSLIKGADYDGDKICTILVKGNNGEQIAGSFNIDWENATINPVDDIGDTNKSMSIGVYKTLSATPVEVIIPLPAQTYENGLTLTVIDENGHFMAQKTKKLEVKRAEVVTFETPLAFAPKDDTDILTSLIAGESGSITITDDIYIDAEVISDAGNVNMEYNYNGDGELDKTLSLRTSYIQRSNGAQGYRLTFNAAETTTQQNERLTRYARTVIAVKEAKLTKEANPTRYTISGLKANKILQAKSAEALTATKAKSINELTDADVYTWVSLQNVEAGIRGGGYTNINNSSTYTPYMNVVPFTFYDNNGGNIRMLTNIDTNAAWSRNGTAVPTEPCTLNGIVVNTKLDRYYKDGNAGKYQIRVVDGNDIVPDANGTASATHVEWNLDWQTDANAIKPTSITKNTDGGMTPDIGEGSLISPHGSYSRSNALHRPTTAKVSYTQYQSGSTSETEPKTDANGAYVNAAVNFACPAGKSWWNFTTNKGEAIIAKFSTSGLSGKKAVAVFDVLAGGSATNHRFPSHWHLEYSIDNGTTWTNVSDDVITIRPMFVWQGSLYKSQVYAASYYNDYAIALPDDVMGQDNVQIALRPSSTVCEHGLDGKRTASDAEVNLTADGVSTGNGSVYFNTFSIRYF